MDDLPTEKRALLERIVAALRPIPNVAAIVLGGSHASGTYNAQSDLDIGLYYHGAEPFSIDAVCAVARQFSVSGHPVVTGFGEWGPWVNGGAWIDADVCKVDFLYRRIDQVKSTIQAAIAGQWKHDFDQQPPFGFRSVIYLAETSVCLPLYDPSNEVARMKETIAVYPPALKQRIVQECLWGTEFSLMFANTFAERRDVPNTVGSLTRAFHYLVQVLFALNETYFLSDKAALGTVSRFARKPEEFAAISSLILGKVGQNQDELLASVHIFQKIFQATAALTEGAYQPKFTVPGE